MPTPAFTKENSRFSFGEQFGSAGIEMPASSAAQWIGKVKNVSGFGPKNKLDQHWFSSDKGRLAFEAADLGVDIDGVSVVYEVQDGALLALAAGTVDDQGTASGASSTLNGAVAAEATSIVLAGASTFANNDYVCVWDVGSTGIAEIRKVSSGGGTTTLVLDKFLRRAHATGAAVKKVVAPFTHTLEVLADNPRPFTLQGVYRPGTAQELAMQLAGMHCTDFTFNQDLRDLLVCTYNMAGSKPVDVTPPASLPIRSSAKSYRYADAAYTYFGGSINGVVGHSLSWSNGGGMEPWSRTPNGEFAAEFVPGRAVFDHTISWIGRDDSVWNALIARTTGLSCTILYTRGTNDSLSINMTGGVLIEAPHNAEDEGKVTVPMHWLPGEVQLVFVNSDPYY